MSRNRLRLLLIAAILPLGGCYVSNRALINPQTKEKADCSSWGIGLIGAPVAAATTSNCIDKYRAMGYVEEASVDKNADAQVEQTPASSASTSQPNKPPEEKTGNRSEDVVEKLKKLKSLKEEGILTNKEYEDKKNEIIRNF